MKKPCYILLICLFFGLGIPQALHAQTVKTAKELIDEGIKLHDDEKYEEAIEKYKEALKIDPKNLDAPYEIAYSLYSLDKKKEAIPYLEKVINAPTGTKYNAYEMLGNIYDDLGQADKAIGLYKKGITENPNYAKLRFNLGVTYMGQKKYAEAEASAIEGIKIDPTHPGSQWLYATVNDYTNNRLKAILGFSGYLLLEPRKYKSTNAFLTLQKLLTNGVTKTSDKSINISVSDDMLSPEKTGDLLISTSAAAIVAKELPPLDELTELLTSAYKIAGELAEKKPNDFFSTFFADYFQKLAKTDNMPAFARYISISKYGEDNLAWFKANDDKLDALSNWVVDNPRKK